MRSPNEREALASTIERFVNGQASPHEWDDFVGIPFADSDLENIRQECLVVQQRFPPSKNSAYCNDEGAAYLLDVVARLRRQA